MSSDDEPVTNQIADPTVVTEEDYREMLHTHRKRRKADLKVVLFDVATCSLVAITSGLTLVSSSGSVVRVVDQCREVPGSNPVD